MSELPTAPSLTHLLQEAGQGNASAWNHAFELVYQELKNTARRLLGAGGQATLSPTALVHECYLRLSDVTGKNIESRAHFHALAARAMRFVVINRARDRFAQKRGSGDAPVSLDERQHLGDIAREEDREAHEFIALDQALLLLEKENPEHVRALECRIFAGLTDQEAADALGLPLRSYQREFAAAKVRVTELLAV